MDDVPRHIAIIMDGNGRWALQKGLLRTRGHEEGARALKRTLQYCIKKGVQVLTIFAFGRENWQRPKQEVKFLMLLFLKFLKKEVAALHEKNVRLRFVGERLGLGKSLVAEMENAEALTQENTGLSFVVAINYSGRWDIEQAVRKCGQLEHFSYEAFETFLALDCVGDPDLLIRTSGEQRLSNFLLWNMAYTEMYFTSTLWPDFGPETLEAALNVYASRQRRFGKTQAQITQKKPSIGVLL